MKLRIFAVLALLCTMGAVAQVGGNDWTFAGGPFTITKADGATWTYSIYYSPSTVTRRGDFVAITFDTITAGSATNFYENNINCRTHQYTFAKYDTSVTPATLSAPSEWKDIQPNTAGSTMFPLFCR